MAPRKKTTRKKTTRRKAPARKKKSKSRVNEAGNYTKPTMRKRLFNRIKAGSKGGAPGQKSQKSLKKWGKQKWGYVTKGDEKKPKSKRGRYLPKSVRSRLTPSQKAATNRKKRKAGGVGSRAKYSKKVKKAVRRAK